MYNPKILKDKRFVDIVIKAKKIPSKYSNRKDYKIEYHSKKDLKIITKSKYNENKIEDARKQADEMAELMGF